MASRNGLNPKIRGQKGIGFNRALPAPFGFGNGLYASSGKISIPRLANGSFLQKAPFTIEFWTKSNVGASDGYYWLWLYIKRIATPAYEQTFSVNSGLGLFTTDNTYRGGNNVIFNGTPQHCVWSVEEDGQCYTYFDGIFRANMPGQTTPYYPDSFYLNMTNNVQAFDEFRYYSKALRRDQIEKNYNAGIGNNPCETENLKVWLKFERFENLDFSQEQDGSDIRLGIRDLSNQNNHGQPLDLDTNPLSPSYCLKPF
ncbi:MAG: hypothetical protein V4520_17975 [Bacteroidota bacterium]